MPNRIFGPKRDKITECRRMHNKEFYALCSSPNIIRVIKSRRMRWAEHVVGMGERGGVSRFKMKKTEEWRPLDGPRHRREDNIKMDIREIGWVFMDWIDLAQDRGNQPAISINCGKFLY